MIRKILTMMIGLCVVSVAGAVNDPDSTGRLVKYLDMLNSTVVSFSTPGTPCYQFPTDTPPPPQVITCVALAGQTPSAFEPLPLTHFGDIYVGANDTRSLITLNLDSVSDVILFNPHPARASLLLNANIKVIIENSALNDPTLINPRTGQPFNGKIETTYQWTYDRRIADAGESFVSSNKMPFDIVIASRKSLTSIYGLSPTRAAYFFSRPTTVRLSVTGNIMGNGRANFFMHGRLMGD
jgi:hypothetical protein